jgi:hypothetical protein
VLGAGRAIIAELAGEGFGVAVTCNMVLAEVSNPLQAVVLHWWPTPIQGKMHGSLLAALVQSIDWLDSTAVRLSRITDDHSVDSSEL